MLSPVKKVLANVCEEAVDSDEIKVHDYLVFTTTKFAICCSFTKTKMFHVAIRHICANTQRAKYYSDIFEVQSRLDLV